MNLKEALAKLESMGDEKRRAHNAKAWAGNPGGAAKLNQFGCAMGDVRALAKKLKTDHELALQLWKTGNVDAQLLAILLMKPKALSAADLDKMVREARFAWVADWFNAYIVKEQPPADKEALRLKWMKDKDGWAARAGWNLTASRIAQAGKEASATKGAKPASDNVLASGTKKTKGATPGKGAKAANSVKPGKTGATGKSAKSGESAKTSNSGESSATYKSGAGGAPDGLDLPALLDRIESQMAAAPPETQWTMNNTLMAIGIQHAQHRQRAIAIGEKIGLYKDWPVSKGCTPPYAPIAINELVKRQE